MLDGPGKHLKHWGKKQYPQFITTRGFFTAYAMSCGYREKAEHPKDDRYYVVLERVTDFYRVELYNPLPQHSIVYEGRDLKKARDAFVTQRKTLVVNVALMKAGVQL